tara:strand:+ start:3543 stop:4853 length:1311 start_codon:yes stop_codon:yes gene_type:complete
MRFRFNYTLLFIIVFGLNLVLGQEYFSTFFPVNNFPMGARSMAMGGSRLGSVSNPAVGSFGKPLYFSFDISRRSYTEKRSFPVIDMFDDVVTQNVYVLNRPAFSSFSWTLGNDFTKYFKLPISISVSGSPFWDMRYDYSEEVRASLGPGVYNRDPVVGYHLINVDGMIQVLRLGLAAKVGSKVRVGLSLESLYENDLSYESGVHVIDQDDALAGDTTMIHNISLSIDQVMRPSLGSIIDLKKHLSLGLSFKPSADIIFQTGGLVPTVNEKTQLPGLSFSDSTSRYTVSLPQELNFSMSARLDNPTKTTVTGGFTYLDWENHDTQTVNHILVDTVNFKYQSTIGISFGVEHWILNKTPFRFGFIYSESPFGSEFEITKVSIGSGWVYDNISVDVAAIFGSVEYMYNDLFVPQGQSSSALERVNESNAVLKATIKYSF